MRPLRGMTVLALACAAGFASAQTYKWRDERGVVHYGEKAPAGQPSTVVDTRPYGVESADPKPCHTILCQGERMEDERRRRAQAEAEQARSQQPVVAQASPRGMDFSVFVKLHTGMSEGELLQRAGTPDFQSVDGLRDSVARTYYYYPTSSNPFTTIVTLRGGRIVNLERIRKF